MNRLLITLLCLSALVARAELIDRVAAVVNNDIITLSEVETRIAPDAQRLRNEPDATKRAEARTVMVKRGVDLLIGEKLMESQVRELNIEVADSEIEMGMDDVKKQNNITTEQFEGLLAQEGYTLSSYKAFMRKHLARLKLVNLKVRSKVKISDEDLKAEYARWAHDEANEFEVHARHLLVQVAPKATAEQIEVARLKATMLMEEARKPGTNFAELAKKKSEGPSAADGGDLGFFKRGVMVAEFEKAAFTLPVGGISDPIRTKFGWHVLKVEEHKVLAAPPFDEVKEQLRDKMLRGQLEKYTDQYVQELRAAAVVDVKI
ncbi:MAG: peptidylprolyl isomerase [Archangium sp.]|nr:peptidylprolyl isomerase [Archangium sp.]MDP3153239.1 peptidylprolyl isomerase [Archangium sp.]MDP3570273.1 peptidylprolyl isomerase [Archangium sp.]